MDFFLRSVLIIIAVLAAFVGTVVVTVFAPELAGGITAAGGMIIALTGSIIGIAVALWGVVEDEDWSLREAIRLVAGLVFVACILAGLAFFILLRRG